MANRGEPAPRGAFSSSPWFASCRLWTTFNSKTNKLSRKHLRVQLIELEHNRDASNRGDMWGDAPEKNGNIQLEVVKEIMVQKWTYGAWLNIWKS